VVPWTVVGLVAKNQWINGQTLQIFVVFGDPFQKTSEGINTQYKKLVSGWFFTWYFLTSQRSGHWPHWPRPRSGFRRVKNVFVQMEWVPDFGASEKIRENVLSVPWFFSTKHGRFDKHGDFAWQGRRPFS